MRLREIQQILKGVDFEASRLTYSPSSHTFSNLDNFKTFLTTIDPLSIYDDQLSRLYDSKLYETANATLELVPNSAEPLLATSNYLVNSASSLSIVFEKLLPSTSTESINVKLPDPSDFEALVKNMSVLQKSISQVVVHKDIDGYVTINNWEHGSFWIELALGSQAAVAVVSSIAWSAAVVCKKYRESQALEKAVRAMDIKNESLQDILEKQQELTRILVEAETNQVAKKHYEDIEPEHIKRIETTITTFAKLIQEGAEVHPALMAPENVQNLFPNYKNIDSITSQIKLLEQLSANSSESE